MRAVPIAQLAQRMRDAGHPVGASLLAKWSFGVAFVATGLVFALIEHDSDLIAALKYFGVLISLAYWLMEAHFLRRRWRREP